jgi:hypothetical protein
MAFGSDQTITFLSSITTVIPKKEATIKQTTGEIAEKANAMHADHAGRRQEAADSIRQDATGKEMVDGLITEKPEKMREMADFAAERLIAFHGTLTPGHREKIAARIEDPSSGGRHVGRRSGHHPHGGRRLRHDSFEQSERFRSESDAACRVCRPA